MRPMQRAAHVVSVLLPSPQGESAAPPEWVELIPAGTFSGRDGRGPYTLDIGAVLAAFEKGGIDLPIDYEHQTLSADEKAGPVPAAGWIKELAAREGALWGRVQWTPRAAELIGQKEYRFLSPVFRHDKAGRVLALEGAGLTHYPNLDLTPVAHQKGAPMDDDLLEQLRYVLNLPTLTAPQDLIAELQKLMDRLKAAEASAAQSRQIDPAEWVPMSQHRAVAEELHQLQKAVAKDKAEAAVREAMSAGKLAPAMQTWAQAYAEKDPEGFAAWCAAAPVIVAPDASAHRVAPNAGTAAEALTEDDRIACQLLGMSEADFAAHKKTLTCKE